MYRHQDGELQVLLAHPGGPFKGDCDPAKLSATRLRCSGIQGGPQMEFPEIDRADFSDVAAVGRKIKASQLALVEEWQQIVLGKPNGRIT